MAEPNEQRYKVHNSYIWLGSLSMVIGLLVVMFIMFSGSIVSLVAGSASEAYEAFIALIGVTVLMVVLGVGTVLMRTFAYKHLYFTIGTDEFSLYSGIFNKTRVHVPYGRIQSVDQHATLMQRIFGVCNVSIDTAGGSANKTVQVPYMTKQQAEWLRSQLYSHKRAIDQARVSSVATAAQGIAVPQGYGEGTASGVEGGLGHGGIPMTTGTPMTTTTAVASGAPGTTAPTVFGAPGTTGTNVLDAGKAVWDEVGGVFAGSFQESVPISYEYGLTNKELLLAGLSNNTAFAAIVLAILGVIAQVLPLVMDIAPEGGRMLYDGFTVSLSSEAVIVQSLLFGLGALIALTVFIWLLSGVGSCINYGGFRARRRGSRIEVEHGLLQHTLQGVDIDRVQAVVIKQTFIRRIMGYCELTLSKIDAVGETSESGQQSASVRQGIVIHPFLKLGRVNEVLAGIIPEYQGVPQSPTKLSPKALRRGVIRNAIWQGSGFWLAVCALIAQVSIHLAVGADTAPDTVEALLLVDGIAALAYLVAIVFFVLNIISAVLWARESSFAYNQRFMQVTTGGFSRQTVNFPRQKIQYGTIKTNPLQRMAKTATIIARTAAGVGGTNIALMDVTEADADAWLAWVKPRR